MPNIETDASPLSQAAQNSHLPNPDQHNPTEEETLLTLEKTLRLDFKAQYHGPQDTEDSAFNKYLLAKLGAETAAREKLNAQLQAAGETGKTSGRHTLDIRGKAREAIAAGKLVKRIFSQAEEIQQKLDVLDRVDKEIKELRRLGLPIGG